jgi:cold shock CspA family protein
MSTAEEIKNTQEDIISEHSESVVLEEIEETNSVRYIGQCKWFSDKLGYGFLTICDGDKKGTDIFAHHSGIKPLNSNYKTLKKGEYVEFNIINGVNGLQAMNVTGINGGALMCDFVTLKRPQKTAQDLSKGSYYKKVVNMNEWQEVPVKKHTGFRKPVAGVVGGSKYMTKREQP